MTSTNDASKDVNGTLIFSGTGRLMAIQYPEGSSLRAYCSALDGFGDMVKNMVLVNGKEVPEDYKLQADDEISISPRNSKNAS